MFDQPGSIVRPPINLNFFSRIVILSPNHRRSFAAGELRVAGCCLLCKLCCSLVCFCSSCRVCCWCFCSNCCLLESLARICASRWWSCSCFCWSLRRCCSWLAWSFSWFRWYFLSSFAFPVLEKLGRAVGGMSLGWRGATGRDAELKPLLRVPVVDHSCDNC